MLTLHEGKLYFNFVAGENHADVLGFFVADQTVENFMVSQLKFQVACEDA